MTACFPVRFEGGLGSLAQGRRIRVADPNGQELGIAADDCGKKRRLIRNVVDSA